MHCKIRHFAQAEIQYSTDLFNRIGRQQTFTADCFRPQAVIANSRKRTAAVLLDHFVGAYQKRLRDRETQLLGGLAVDKQL